MPNATSKELEAAFHMYFAEMQRCRDQNLGWALLHLVVCMPDICAALAHGETSGQRYADWCAACLRGGRLTPDERYQIRCKLLHEGSTVPRQDKPNINWDSFRFMPPASGRHGESEGRTLLLDVGELHEEMTAGMRSWFADVEAGTAAGASDVRANLSKLVTVEPRPTRDPISLMLGAPVFTTASGHTGTILVSTTKTKP